MLEQKISNISVCRIMLQLYEIYQYNQIDLFVADVSHDHRGALLSVFEDYIRGLPEHEKAVAQFLLRTELKL